MRPALACALRRNKTAIMLLERFFNPVRVCLSAAAKIKADPNICVVRADHRNCVIFRRVHDLINKCYWE